MNHILIVITYHVPGNNPVITSAVVPFESHMSFDMHKKNVLDQYRTKPYFDVTVTQF